MLPPLTREGWLPPGIHWAAWEELAARFGGTPHRERLLAGLKAAAENLARAGCQELYIDGSFVTRKAKPNDFDACWNSVGVIYELLDPVLLDFSRRRSRMREKYGGELFIAAAPADSETGRRFPDYFQRDRRTGKPKGIIGLRLGRPVEGER